MSAPLIRSAFQVRAGTWGVARPPLGPGGSSRSAQDPAPEPGPPMSDELLERYLRQHLETQIGPEIEVSWHGEPTAMGLGFFRRALAHQQRHRRPTTRIVNRIHTDGLLLDEEWCAFLKEHEFQVGLSLDGPRGLHDPYRMARGGEPGFDRTMAALHRLQRHRVPVDLLATVHAGNVGHSLEVYRFLRDQAEARFIEFLPVVERKPESALRDEPELSARSVRAEQLGRFYVEIFDDWIRHDVGRVFVQMFDVALAAWVGQPAGQCVFSPTCGDVLALEPDGRVYCCDRYIDPRHLLGALQERPLGELARAPAQRVFGRAKLDTLPRYCRDCEVRFACHGGCPKDRFIVAPDGEPGLSYLCVAYRSFFRHVDRPMRRMADLLKRGRPPAEIMFDLARPQDPCPCGGGRSLERCHRPTLVEDGEAVSPGAP